MALPDNSRHSLIPGYLYSSSFSSPSGGRGLLDLDMKNSPCLSSSSQGPSHSTRGIVIPAPKEKIQMHSPSFYAACTAGGILSCGLTHMAVTPLDLVKCNMQVFHFHPSHLIQYYRSHVLHKMKCDRIVQCAMLLFNCRSIQASTRASRLVSECC